MPSSDKFADIFGECVKHEVDISAARTSGDDSTAPGLFKANVDNQERGFYNCAFLGDDGGCPSATTPATQPSNVGQYVDAPYNPYEHRSVHRPTSFWGTIFHLVFLSAGSPVLFIPAKFATAGYVSSALTMLFIFALYMYSMRKLLWSAHEMCKAKQLPSISYANLVYEAFYDGPATLRPLAGAARLLISSVFFFGWYGAAVLTYLLIVENASAICANWLHAHWSLHELVLVAFVPLLLLSLVSKLKFLEPCSSLGFACNLASVLLVLQYTITDPTPWRGDNMFGPLNQIPLLMGAVLININCTGLMISLKNEMRQPTRFDSPAGVMTVAYAIILAMYFVFSLFFAFKYSAAVPENAISLIPTHLVLSLVNLTLYVVGLLLLFPVLFYVPVDVLWNDLLGRRGKPMQHKLAWTCALRIFLLLVALVLAYVNPNISFFVSLIGTVGTSIDSVIFPATIHTLVVWRLQKDGVRSGFRWIAARNACLIAVGACIMVAGVYDCVQEV